MGWHQCLAPAVPSLVCTALCVQTQGVSRRGNTFNVSPLSCKEISTSFIYFLASVRTIVHDDNVAFQSRQLFTDVFQRWCIAQDLKRCCHFTESIPSFSGCLLSAVCEEGCLVTPSESVKGEKCLRLNWTDTLANIVNRQVPRVFSSTKGNPKFRKLNLVKCCH